MCRIKYLWVALLAVATLNAAAADWDMVESTADQQMFFDTQSVNNERTGLVQVRVLENFSKTNEEMGQGVYEHKSRVMLVGVDCQSGLISYEQWSLHAGALGTGSTVWADSMQNGPAFFRPEHESGYDNILRNVCSSALAQPN
jgi:hypothetical protein